MWWDESWIAAKTCRTVEGNTATPINRRDTSLLVELPGGIWPRQNTQDRFSSTVTVALVPEPPPSYRQGRWLWTRHSLLTTVWLLRGKSEPFPELMTGKLPLHLFGFLSRHTSTDVERLSSCGAARPGNIWRRPRSGFLPRANVLEDFQKREKKVLMIAAQIDERVLLSSELVWRCAN